MFGSFYDTLETDRGFMQYSLGGRKNRDNEPSLWRVNITVTSRASTLKANHQSRRPERESKSQEATVKPTRVLWPFAWAWLSFLNTVWGFSHIWKATWLLSSQRLTKELSLGLDSKNLSSGRCLGFDLLVLTSWTLRMTQQCPPSIANREAFH